MNDEQWARLIDSLEVKFPDLKKEKSEFETTDDIGQKINNEVETIEFSGAEGKFKVERVTKPLILDKKVHYTHSAGGQGKVEYKFSDTEKSHKVNLYRWDEDSDDWSEVKTEGGFRF